MKSTQSVLFIDIENTPIIGYTWGLWEQNVIRKQQDSYLLCAAYKWLGKKGVKATAQIDSPSYHKDKTNDKNVILELWRVLDQADIVIAHNGARFDLPKINSRFISYGITPPSPYKVVDTLQIARKYFKFDSNKLDDLGKQFGVGRKVETGGFDLWLDCMAGKEEAWKKMIRYNKQDVALLEEVYLKLLPWITNHPFIGNDKEECPNCKSKHTQGRGIEKRKGGKQIPRCQCQDCGKWFYGK